QQNDHGMIAPVILIGPCWREMQRQKLFEEQRTEPMLQARHKMDHFCQRGSKSVCVLEIFGEFHGDACFFTELQVKKYMLLAGEVEEERSVGDARGRDDRIHIGACHPRALELGDRRPEYALAG